MCVIIGNTNLKRMERLQYLMWQNLDNYCELADTSRVLHKTEKLLIILVT